jgi:hypothetical protein
MSDDRVAGREAVSQSQTERPKAWGFYLVAFVDLLGQQEALRRLEALPHTRESKNEVMEAVYKTAQRVIRVRKAFERFFDEARTRRSLPTGLSAEQMDDYTKMREATVFYQIGFSDSFVIAVPLVEHEFGAAPCALGVWAALFGIAGIFLTTLAEEIPLRAGIAVERGLNLFRNEVYGPALLHAYHLESKCAEFPRAAVGDGLLGYLSYLDRLDDEKHWNRLARNIAGDCRQVITYAPDDGHPMLHMLSSRLLGIGPLFGEAATRAYKWTKQEHERHREAGNQKLSTYYYRLLGYFNANGYQG